MPRCCWCSQWAQSSGLWEFARIAGQEVLSAAIIVGSPNPLVQPIHDRMPVILSPEDYDRWLDRSASVDELRAMLKPCSEDLLEAYAVNRAVNSVRNDTEECIEPAADEENVFKLN